jgi:hypothetical protein
LSCLTLSCLLNFVLDLVLGFLIIIKGPFPKKKPQNKQGTKTPNTARQDTRQDNTTQHNTNTIEHNTTQCNHKTKDLSTTVRRQYKTRQTTRHPPKMVRCLSDWLTDPFFFLLVSSFFFLVILSKSWGQDQGQG